MRAVMVRFLVGGILAMAAAMPHAQQVPASSIAPSTVDRPERLLAVQQLAFAAYPELRTQGLQLRVESSSAGATVTFGFAQADRDTVLAVSRPRAAVLVIEATFDSQERLTRAVLRGTLAHLKERREARASGTDVARVLEDGGASFPPSKRAAFLQQLNLQVVKALAGTLTATDTTFQNGTTELPLYWEVSATSPLGDRVTLGFEPYAGRLVKFVRGGGQ